MGRWGFSAPSARQLTAALLTVTLAWTLLQLVVLWPIGRFLTYDEAIYLSQVYPDTPSLHLSAPRSRGITWLLAPVSVFEPSVGVVRGYLLALSAVLFFVAFRAWLPVLGLRAVVAAVVFGSIWVTLFYGGEIYPNLPVALGAVAATGYLARHLTAEDVGWRALAAAAAATAFVTLIRPIDGSVLAVAVALAAVTRDLRVLVIRWAAVGVAVVAAWTPWVVEAYLSYGGLRERFDAAAVNVATGELGPLDVIRQHLRLTDGPLHGGDASIPTVGMLWWLVFGLAALAACWQGLRRRPELLSPALAAMAFAAEYVLMTSVVTARFLLPVYALGAICLAATLRVPAKAPYRVAVAVLLTAWLVWNVPFAVAVNNAELGKRQERAELGAVVRGHAQGRDCVLVAQGNYPEMAFAGGCFGVLFTAAAETVRVPPDHVDDPVYVLVHRRSARSKLLQGPGELRVIDTANNRRWWLFIPENSPTVQ